MEKTAIQVKEIDKRLLEAIDKVQLSERAARLKELYLTSQPGVAGERVPLTIQAWQESEGYPLDLRWAELTKRVLEGIPTPIFSGQKLVGNITKYFRGAYPHPEMDGSYLAPLLAEEKGKSTLGGPVEKGVITEDDLKLLLEGAKFWKGKTLTEMATKTVKEVMGNWYEDYLQNGLHRIEALQGLQEINGWGAVVQKGLRGIIKEIQDRIARFIDNREDDISKLHFWKAALMSLEAVIAFARRYAKQAKELAAKEQAPARRSELEEIGRICEWVPENPARNFREGLQSVILLHCALSQISPCLPPATWGRPDRYLYPLFKQDIAEGRLTPEEAVDLVSDLFLYAARLELHMEMTWRDYIQRSLYSNLGLAGTDEEGRDVCNELTYLILHALGLTRYAGANVMVGWHKDIAPWIMEKAIESAWKCGGGMPQFQNIDHAINLMQEKGIDLVCARNWSSHGCSQINPSDSPLILNNAYYNIALCVDLALHNGLASKTGMRLGAETGDPRTFKTFEELYQAFQKQAEHLIRKQTWHDKIVDRVRLEYFRQPLVSSLMPGCIEKGLDNNAGGLPHYAFNFMKDRGLIPAGDSLTAIKKLVYDEKKVTMEELLDAIDNNFDGGNKRREEIKQLCLEAPKYGNELGEPEEVVRKISKFTAGVIESEKNIFGYPYVVNRNGQGWHFMVGKVLAALPTGRKAGEALPDGSMSPMQGMDRNGPTALLNSVLKADFSEALAGIFTVKMPASLFKTQELRNKLTHLTDSFLRQGGTYVQYNILDAKVLREAKRNPGKFRDLVVRVGGYSAYFVNLSPEIQDEIIARTEHALA